MMVVVVVMVMAAVSGRYHDDAGRIFAILAVVMVVMMVMDIELRQLDVFVR